MKQSITWIAGCAICAFAGMAQADCAEDLARLTSDDAMTSTAAAPEAGAAEGGIAKDGSLAPLETPDTDMTADEAGEAETSSAAVAPPAEGDTSGAPADGIAKDGSLAPLEGTQAESDTAVAMSGADVQAQQEGEPTAAEAADPASDDMASDAAASGDMASDNAASGDRDALVADAQAALDAGDEAACQAAVDQINAL